MNHQQLFFASVLGNDTNKVIQILQEKPELVNSYNDKGYTALMITAGAGNTQLTRILIEKGANVNALDSINGASPLHTAALNNHTEIADLLVKANAHLNLQAPSHGMTPLMNAVWYRNPAMVQWFLNQERINPSLKNGLGLTAEGIIKAMSADFRRTQQLAPDEQQMQQYFDAFHKKRSATATSRQLVETVANYDKQLNPQEILQRTKALIAQGADVNTREYVNGKGFDYHTPLLIASLTGLTDVVKVLLDAGADITLTCEYMKANAAHKAAYAGHAAVLELLAAHPQFGKIKDAMGPYNGYTPLHDAIWHGHVEATKVLLKAGVNKNITALDGLTPLAMAKKYSYVEIAGLLEP